MGRSKLRAAKKPPPRPTASNNSNATNNPATNTTNTNSNRLLPPLNHPLIPLDLPPPPGGTSSLIPPSTAVDLNDPNFRTAWQNWTTSALGRLDQLPKLSQSQLNAIAGAAAGIDGTVSGAQNLGIDLPASLAALFEAKLTLDREKAKLVRMQKELKGYKDAAGNGTITAPPLPIPQSQPPHSHGHHHHAHSEPHPHSHQHPHQHQHHHPVGNVIGNGKGKEVVVVEDDYGECTCHEQEEYYDTDEECYDCDCDCHGCEHEEEPRSTLADDPERFDEAVRELFNWIKAVVWTIEQAAIVAGKRR